MFAFCIAERAKRRTRLKKHKRGSNIMANKNDTRADLKKSIKNSMITIINEIDNYKVLKDIYYFMGKILYLYDTGKLK